MRLVLEPREPTEQMKRDVVDAQAFGAGDQCMSDLMPQDREKQQQRRDPTKHPIRERIETVQMPREIEGRDGIHMQQDDGDPSVAHPNRDAKERRHSDRSKPHSNSSTRR